jgi:hypothetical protein
MAVSSLATVSVCGPTPPLNTPVAVNGTSLAKAKHEDAVAALKSAGRKVTLKVARMIGPEHMPVEDGEV